MFFKVTDNYIPEEEFKQIQNQIMGHNFHWYTRIGTDFSYDDNPRFVHPVYNANEPKSEIYEVFKPIYQDKILISCKINCDWRKETKKEGLFHEDCQNISDYRTCILFLNTNNGYTEFENGTIIDSAENRFIEFDGKIKHRGVSQTDEPFRYVLNINFLKYEHGTQ